MRKESARKLNSITPTKETQRLRVEQAAQVVNGRQRLEESGFFRLTGIDSQVHNERIYADAKFDLIKYFKDKVRDFSGRIPCIKPFSIGNC